MDTFTFPPEDLSDKIIGCARLGLTTGMYPVVCS
jgi:hypothetical protein